MPAIDQPRLSVLIAARNEESTIADCLRAIDALTGVVGQPDCLIGNDQSADRTTAVVTSYIARKPAFRLVNINAALPGLQGKANVLAQLARQARGSFLLFTDADTQVPPAWATALLAGFSGPERVGIVSGITLPEGPRLVHKLQTIDWLYNLTLTHLLSRMGVAVTAMGNNMAVSREAYEAVGGYESLPFSVVEDYALFRAIVGKGYGFRNLLDERVLARTRPVDTLRDFLHQRKRWMRGAHALPGWMVALLYGQYLAGPLLLGLGAVAPGLAIGLYVARMLGQTLVIFYGLARLHRTRLWPYVFLFDPYQLLMGPLAVLFYWLPTRLNWKGRQYD